MAAITIYSDAWWTLVGVSAVALGVIVVLLLMKWESHRATTIWEKRSKKK
jgi:hypothetical protein